MDARDRAGPTAIVVGRDPELRRIRAAHAELSVAIVYGVAGVGKSTLALAYAAQWAGPVAYVKGRAGWTLAELGAAIHRALPVARYGVGVDDGEPLAGVWAVVEQLGCLAVIDDLHLLPAAESQLLLETATQALRTARLVATSRELTQVSPGRPDRLQLRLEPLDRSSARILWERLIELYGPGSDFETAWHRSRGNPFLLRQAHVAALPEQDPLESSVRGLSQDERRLANVLAVAHRALPREVVTRLPIPDAIPSLRTLVTRLIVDVTPDAEYQMHDLWREVVTRDLDRGGLEAAAGDLVIALSGSTLDTFSRIHELAWHLRYLGRHAEIGALLVAHSTELVRQGGTADLLRELDELPAEVMSTELLLLRARTLARGLQVQRAYRELRRLIEAGDRSPQAGFFLASSATMIGEFAAAHEILQRLADQGELDPRFRAMTRLGLAWNHACRGALADARALVREGEAGAPPPRSRTLPLHLFVLTLEGQHEAAADLALDWLAWLRDNPSEPWSRQVTPVLAVMALSAVGRFDEAEDVARRMARCVHAPADSIELGWARMTIRYERGERAAALAYFSDVRRALDHGGHLAGAIWTRAVTGRLLLLVGRRREALADLARAHEACHRCQTSAYDPLLEAAAADDPLSSDWLSHDPVVPAGKHGDATRNKVKAVLRMACTGGPAMLDRTLPDVAIPATADHGFDRALLELAHAIVARRRGQLRVEARHLRQAAVHAGSAGADEDVLPRLHDVLLDLAVPPGPVARAASDRRLVIDGVRHEIRIGAHRILLASRPAARQLLYAFAAAPSNHLTRMMIARALWEAEYDPLRHDSTIKSNIRRLRTMLAGLAEVQVDHGGYHLVLPEDAIVVPPVESS